MPWPRVATCFCHSNGQLLDRGGVALAVDQQAAMRARADAGIFAVAPVDEVVDRFLAGAGVVGNLVGGQAGVAGQILRQLVEIGAQILVGHLELAGVPQVEVARPHLDGELVERDMALRPATALP